MKNPFSTTWDEPQRPFHAAKDLDRLFHVANDLLVLVRDEHPERFARQAGQVFVDDTRNHRERGHVRVDEHATPERRVQPCLIAPLDDRPVDNFQVVLPRDPQPLIP